MHERIPQRVIQQRGGAITDQTEKWLNWVDNHLVHLYPPNLYRYLIGSRLAGRNSLSHVIVVVLVCFSSFDESCSTFDYLADHSNFSEVL
jgi:hypothetical protein